MGTYTYSPIQYTHTPLEDEAGWLKSYYTIIICNNKEEGL